MYIVLFFLKMLTYYKHPSQFGNIFIYWKRSKLYSFNYNNSFPLLSCQHLSSSVSASTLWNNFPEKSREFVSHNCSYLPGKMEDIEPRVHFQTLQTQSKAQFHDSSIHLFSPSKFLCFSLVVNIQIQGEAFSGEFTQFDTKVK